MIFFILNVLHNTSYSILLHNGFDNTMCVSVCRETRDTVFFHDRKRIFLFYFLYANNKGKLNSRRCDVSWPFFTHLQDNGERKKNNNNIDQQSTHIISLA